MVTVASGGWVATASAEGPLMKQHQVLRALLVTVLAGILLLTYGMVSVVLADDHPGKQGQPSKSDVGYIIFWRDGITPDQRDRGARAAGAVALEHSSYGPRSLALLPGAALARLKSRPDVVAVVPNLPQDADPMNWPFSPPM